MQLDDAIRLQLQKQLVLLVEARAQLVATPAHQIASRLEHALALHGLDSDITRYREVLRAENGLSDSVAPQG